MQPEEPQKISVADVPEVSQNREVEFENFEAMNLEFSEPESGDEKDSDSAKKTTTEKHITIKNGSSLPSTAFAKVEKSLASLGFFTPSSRRIKNQKVKRISMTREIDGKRVEVSAEIHPSGVFGLPVTADQDKYLGLQRIITNTLQSEGKITNPIRFKSADLLRILDTSRKSGKNYKEVSEWLDVMSATTIISDGAVWSSGQKRFARDRFRVFERAVSVGRELEDGTIADANYVWLSNWQLENINNKFLIPIDLETYRELKNHIAKALVPLLQIWLYASNKAGSFEKRYEELCEMLTLQTYRAPSQISRQFKPSLDELAQHEYLEKWRIEKTSDRKGYKIVFFHGSKFHRDQRKRREQKEGLEPSVIVAEYEPVEPNLPEPGRSETKPPSQVATSSGDGLRVEQPEHREIEGKLVDELAARGLVPSIALKLLRSLPTERLHQASDCIEYWDAQKRVKQVGEGLLYDLIRNGELPAGFETRRQRADRLALEGRKAKVNRVKETLETRYEESRRVAVDRFIAEALPPEEFDRRVASYKADMLAQPGIWSGRPEMAEGFAQHAVRAEIAKGATPPTYEDFYRRELPGVLSEFQLDPADFGILSDPPMTDTLQNALNEPTEAVSQQNAENLISEEN